MKMLKVGSKRRRTQAQVKADKEEALIREQDIQVKMARLAEAEQKLQKFDQLEAQNEQAKELMRELHAAGHVDIDENGNVSPSKQKPLM